MSYNLERIMGTYYDKGRIKKQVRTAGLEGTLTIRYNVMSGSEKLSGIRMGIFRLRTAKTMELRVAIL